MHPYGDGNQQEKVVLDILIALIPAELTQSTLRRDNYESVKADAV